MRKEQLSNLSAFIHLLGCALIYKNQRGKRTVHVVRQGGGYIKLEKVVSLYNKGLASKYFSEFRINRISWLGIVVTELPRKPIQCNRKQLEAALQECAND